jgi:hypothetical protein
MLVIFFRCEDVSEYLILVCRAKGIAIRGESVKAAIVPSANSSWEVKMPEPGENQVLIKIRASGMCYTDVQQSRNFSLLIAKSSPPGFRFYWQSNQTLPRCVSRIFPIPIPARIEPGVAGNITLVKQRHMTPRGPAVRSITHLHHSSHQPYTGSYLTVGFRS